MSSFCSFLTKKYVGFWQNFMIGGIPPFYNMVDGVYTIVCELIKLISTLYFLCLILGGKNEPIRYNGINNKQYAISNWNSRKTKAVDIYMFYKCAMYDRMFML